MLKLEVSLSGKLCSGIKQSFPRMDKNYFVVRKNYQMTFELMILFRIILNSAHFLLIFII